MERTYIYKGEQEVSIPEIGIVKPGQEITTNKEINNSLFEEKQKVVKNSKQK